VSNRRQPNLAPSNRAPPEGWSARERRVLLDPKLRHLALLHDVDAPVAPGVIERGGAPRCVEIEIGARPGGVSAVLRRLPGSPQLPYPCDNDPDP